MSIDALRGFDIFFITGGAMLISALALRVAAATGGSPSR